MRRLTDEQIEAGLNAGLSASGIARLYGIPERTGRRAVQSWHKTERPSQRPPIDGMSIDEAIAHRVARFDAHAATHQQLDDWHPIDVTDDGPLALVIFGDPHLDDNGCNFRELLRDIELTAATPGAYGVCVGDITNNWSGRLLRLYADQHTTRSEAHRWARWFMTSGVRWLWWTKGNHDDWGDGGALLDWIANGDVRLFDWRARIAVRAGKHELRVDSAHDFKGSSLWAPGGNAMREAVLRPGADLYVCGHRHQMALGVFERADGTLAHIAKARGYKWHDQHALHNGFPQGRHGASVVAVFNPTAPSGGRLTLFADVPTGLDYLTMLRRPVRSSLAS